MSALGNPVYRFGGFELEPAERRLSQAGESVSLTPKVFDTLVLLVERAGHVVSKDELMKVLWPRGYVDESNLTKHVWLIRRALGDGEHDSRFIETVPKVGYRFVAPVTAADSLTLRDSAHRGLPSPEAPAAPTAVPAPIAAPPPVKWRLPQTRAVLAGVAFVTCLIVAVLAWRHVPRPAPASVAGTPGHTVALVGFTNLSGNLKDAWLGSALTEMLGAEVSAADNLRVLPDELVRDAAGDAGAAAAGGYGPRTLARLRERLDTDFVLSGSYLVTGAAEDAPLRVDLALQDARNGALLASVSRQSRLSGLMGLVSQSGGVLRDKLGARHPDPAALSLLANEQPPSVEVARRMGFAVDALRNYDAARARDELLEAIAAAPGYAPAYTLLSQSWTALGYHDKARAAAEQAASYAGSLPPEQRLQTEAVVGAARSEWDKSAAAWGALVQLKPHSPDYRLQLIDAQIAAGMIAKAQDTQRDLQRLGGAAGDPRVELAAARVAAAANDARQSAAHAANALHQAQQHDVPGLIADAQLALASSRSHLNQNDAARVSLDAAISGYRSIHNPRGEARARASLAMALSNLNREQEAREEYQRAMTLYQSIGDIGGVARVYRDLCAMLWNAGDRDGAQAAARHSLALAREINDLPLQGWTLQALANIAADDAASDEVLADFREVISLGERSASSGGLAWPLATYADILRLRGQLDEARTFCARATADAAGLSDPQFAIYSGFMCALIETDRGNAAAARAGFEDVIRRVGSGGDMTYTNNAKMMLAQLDMDEGRWSAAGERLRQAVRGFAAAEERTGEAEAQAMLALCAQALGNSAERDQAAGQARKLRQSITSRQEVYVVDIAMAQLAGELQKLLALAADAEGRHWLSWALEAKIAAWELLHASSTDRAAAQALRVQIEKSANEHGFGRVLTKLRRLDTA